MSTVTLPGDHPSSVQVRWRGIGRAGFTLGYCTSDGRCAATPPECEQCSAHCGARLGSGYQHK